MNFTWEDYEQALANHDWTFEMSDDHRWWSRGNSQRFHILAMKEFLSNEDKNRAEELFKKYSDIGWGRA